VSDSATNAKERNLGAKGEATRRRLMEAAEEIFGTKGFYHTSIGDITSRAGVAQGTFYLYFAGKVEIFKELVYHLSHELRAATEAAAQAAPNRIEAERLGIEAFYRFVDQHRNLYRIIRQAEFVDEELYRWYYERLAKGYTSRLRQAMERGEIRSVDPELLAWCLMAVSDYTGQRYVLWQDGNRADTGALIDILSRGIRKDAP
jgi:AcrR family transcriptional regulator